MEVAKTAVTWEMGSWSQRSAAVVAVAIANTTMRSRKVTVKRAEAQDGAEPAVFCADPGVAPDSCSFLRRRFVFIKTPQ
jgi:hypothetical protein